MVKRLKAECLYCLTRKYMNTYPDDSTEEQKLEFMRRFCKEITDASDYLAAPVVVRNINDIREEIFGERIDYAKVKPYYNELMLNLQDKVKAKIQKAKDPFLLALKYALIGNYIDFGAFKNVDEKYLFDQLDIAHEKEIDEAVYQCFRNELDTCKKLAYVTDNCGEIVMDKLFVSEIKKAYPGINITVIVRGGKVLNDATLEDAKQVGLTDICTVIGNGNNIAGTWLDELSDEASSIINDADIILTKGQANYETLRGCGKNIYYLFLCKCEMFAREFGVEKLSGMFMRELA